MISRFIIFMLVYFFVTCNTMPAKDGNPITDSLKIKKPAFNYSQGKLVFSRFCTGCHTAPERHATDQYTFDKLFDRLPQPSEDYFIKFIQDTKALKTSGDKYALEISKTWSSDYNHNFKDSLSKQDFFNLIAYIKAAGQLYRNNPVRD
jgi:hypothetical protein